MITDETMVKKWIKLGIICGFAASLIYPCLIFINIPFVLRVIFIMAWGPTLGLSAVGGYYFLALHKETISLKIAVFSQIIAGVLVTTMLLVQLAVKLIQPEVIDASNQWIWNSINNIQLGIDVAWDVYLFIACLLFAVNMFNHPKFGKIFSLSGIIISLLLIAFNIMTFPTPPAEAGSIDMGPLTGLWGLSVTINMLVRFKWVNTKF